MKHLARLFSLAALRRHALLLALLLTAPLFADTSGPFTYEVYNGKATITDFSTYYSGTLTIPSTLGRYPVTAIGRRAFYNCRSLTSVVIPASVTSFGEDAFYGVAPATLVAAAVPSGMSKTNLTSVVIPEGVTSIGNYAFYNCSSLTSVTIPNSVTMIGSNAFSGVAPATLVAAAVPSGMSKTNLTSVTIPEGVTNISESAFYGCTSLTAIILPDGVTTLAEKRSRVAQT